MDVISALFTIALVVAIPLIICIEPIKTYRKLKTPPCRTCSRHLPLSGCFAEEYCNFYERIDPFDYGNDVSRELIRGTR